VTHDIRQSRVDDSLVIVSDCPWRSDFGATSNRATERHYPTMTLDELKAYPIPSARNALLFMWTTGPMLKQSLELMDSWNFEYRTSGVWVKPVKGTGKYLAGQSEPFLLGRRGKFPAPTIFPLPSSVIFAPRRRHSEKPEFLQDEIERVYPGYRYVELFARRKRDGWECPDLDKASWSTEDAA
jgi:N6-adenosine-specific RNA methylase IME4